MLKDSEQEKKMDSLITLLKCLIPAGEEVDHLWPKLRGGTLDFHVVITGITPIEYERGINRFITEMTKQGVNLQDELGREAKEEKKTSNTGKTVGATRSRSRGKIKIDRIE